MLKVQNVSFNLKSWTTLLGELYRNNIYFNPTPTKKAKIMIIKMCHCLNTKGLHCNALLVMKYHRILKQTKFCIYLHNSAFTTPKCNSF